MHTGCAYMSIYPNGLDMLLTQHDMSALLTRYAPTERLILVLEQEQK